MILNYVKVTTLDMASELDFSSIWMWLCWIMSSLLLLIYIVFKAKRNYEYKFGQVERDGLSETQI